MSRLYENGCICGKIFSKVGIMINIFAVRKNINAIYTYARLAYAVSGVRACYLYDPSIKQSVAELENGSEIVITSFPSKYSIYAIKTDKGLKCSLKKDVSLYDGKMIVFKSFEAAIPVMNNVVSYSNAFNQNRCVIRGDVTLGMKVIKILDKAQATLTTKRKRRVYLKQDVYSKDVEFKVKMTAWLRGWR